MLQGEFYFISLSNRGHLKFSVHEHKESAVFMSCFDIYECWQFSDKITGFPYMWET